MATILTKKSDTASAVPLAADLTNAAGGAELAVNATDKRLFSKTSGGTVVELGTNPSSLSVVGNATVGGTLGVTGATTLAGVSATTLSASSTVTLSGGTANGVAYLNGSKVVTSGSALTFDGTKLGIGGAASQLIHAQTSGTTAYLQLQATSGSAYYGIDSAGVYIGSTANIPSIFNVNGSEQMRLTSTGLGIGTSSPTDKLHVAGLARINTGTYSAGYGLTFQANSETSRTYQMGMVTGGAFAIYDSTAAAQRVVLDTSGNLGLGVTPSAWSGYKPLQAGSAASFGGYAGDVLSFMGSNTYNDNTNWKYILSGNAAARYQQSAGTHAWFTAASGTAGNAITFTQAMTLDASGNLLVGTTATSAYLDGRINTVASGTQPAICAKLDPANTNPVQFVYSSWAPFATGNNIFHQFETETTATIRGSISYNRAGGLTVYNTTSDYRAKDIYGPVTGSGALIDSVPVYMGKMKGATQERPMFIAHETPEYAHTGEKDAVDKNGNPVYQQMDASALIPVMWAEIQSLRKRLADAGL